MLPMLMIFKNTISLSKATLQVAFVAFLAACSNTINAPIEDLTRSKTTVKVINGFAKPTNTADASFVYRVRKGDTLYAVAWRFGWDYKALAALNNIPPPYVIYVDEEIAFSPQWVTRTALPTNTTTNTVVNSNNRSSSTNNTNNSTNGTNKTPSQTASKKTTANKQSVPVAGITKATTKIATKAATKNATKTNNSKTVTKPVEKTQVVSKPIKNYVGVKNVGWQWPLRGKLVNKFNARSETSKGIDVQAPQGSSVKAAAKGQVVYAGSGIQGYGNLLIVKHNNTYLSAYAYNSKLLVSEGDIVTMGQPVALSGRGPKFAELLHFEIRKDGKPVNPLKYLPK